MQRVSIDISGRTPEFGNFSQKTLGVHPDAWQTREIHWHNMGMGRNLFHRKKRGRRKKKNDGRWRSLTVNSLFLLDGTAPNIIAIFGNSGCFHIHVVFCDFPNSCSTNFTRGLLQVDLSPQIQCSHIQSPVGPLAH